MTNYFIKPILFAALVVALLASCAPVKTPPPVPPGVQIENPYAPQPGDESLVRDTVEMVNTEIAILKSNPPQFALKISFFTPTPCHKFRITMDQPGAGNRFNVEVYSLMKKDQVCTLMRLNTPTEASLNLGKLSSGHYTVWVNGVKALEFDS
jgi:hypothetical protein